MKRALIGCSGWNYRDWRERFYPKGLPARLWLEHYASRFDTVEINNTFYRLPKLESVTNWSGQTPPHFVFTVKASRYLTHVKRLADIGPGVASFYERIAPLRSSGKLGCTLWQLPPGFRRHDARLATALSAPPRGRHAFEFRHASWFCEDVYGLLRANNAALVIGDSPERPFQTHELTADFTLIRFHYGRRGRNGNYSETELAQWRDRINEWRRKVEVFAYFNNDWNAFAPRNASWLANAVSDRR